MPHFKAFATVNLLLLIFFNLFKSLVELEFLIVATAPYFEHTAPLTYSLCLNMCNDIIYFTDQ
jgi:hypothetical protein